VKVLAGHKVESVDTTEKGVRVTVSAMEYRSFGERTGFGGNRSSNSERLGLEQLDVRISERGFVEIDEKMATTSRNLGDRRPDRQVDAGAPLALPRQSFAPSTSAEPRRSRWIMK